MKRVKRLGLSLAAAGLLAIASAGWGQSLDEILSAVKTNDLATFDRLTRWCCTSCPTRTMR